MSLRQIEFEQEAANARRLARRLAFMSDMLRIIREGIVWIGGAWLVYHVISSPTFDKLLGY